MTPREKIQAGLDLIGQAIVEYVGEHPNGIQQAKLLQDLGLLGDPTKFTRAFGREPAERLVTQRQIRAETKGRSRIYFPVA
jgi:hypothetical protein